VLFGVDHDSQGFSPNRHLRSSEKFAAPKASKGARGSSGHRRRLETVELGRAHHRGSDRRAFRTVGLDHADFDRALTSAGADLSVKSGIR
jgi:hypothetical protein